MAELNLDELERLAKAATPGPWAVDDESKQDFGCLYVAKGRTGKLLGRIAEVFKNCLVRDMAEMEANAQFIAAARNALPALIARIREVEQERDEWKAQSDLHKHMVITCGAAASHPDPQLTRTGPYAGKWNSQQAEQVRALRDERDSLRAKVRELEQDAARLDWLDQAAHCADWVEGEPVKRVIRADDGEEFQGDTWRAAIDAARGGQHG